MIKKITMYLHPGWAGHLRSIQFCMTEVAEMRCWFIVARQSNYTSDKFGGLSVCCYFTNLLGFVCGKNYLHWLKFDRLKGVHFGIQCTLLVSAGQAMCYVGCELSTGQSAVVLCSWGVINQSSQFIVIWHLKGWITHLDK